MSHGHGSQVVWEGIRALAPTSFLKYYLGVMRFVMKFGTLSPRSLSNRAYGPGIMIRVGAPHSQSFEPGLRPWHHDTCFGGTGFS
jgi:hypothetical protein